MLSMSEGSVVKRYINFGSLLEGTSTTGNTAFQDRGFDPTGWELALVTAPSNTTSSASSSQLVGFFDLHIFFFLRYLFFSCILLCRVTPEFRVATAIWAHHSHH